MAPTVRDDQTSRSNERSGSTLRDFSEQAASAGRVAKDTLSEAAASAASVLKEKGADIAEGAQEFASDVKDELQDRISEQKDAGADYMSRLAEAVRRAGREFDRELPIAAQYIGLAASTMDDYAEKMRNGELDDLLESAKRFARQQPTAFLGLTFLAGFGLVRFLKSSSGRSRYQEDEFEESERGEQARS